MTLPAPAGERRVALAAVAGAHGVTGEVRLKLFADDLGSFTKGASLFVGGSPLTLSSIKMASKMPIARFAGVTDRAHAETLRGALVEIPRSALPPLADGEYYHADLIGLTCVDADGVLQGTVTAVEDFGAGELLEIECEGGKRALIPFREPIAALADDRIVLDPDFLA